MNRHVVAGVLGLALAQAGCMPDRSAQRKPGSTGPAVELDSPLPSIHESINKENTRIDPVALRPDHPPSASPQSPVTAHGRSSPLPTAQAAPSELAVAPSAQADLAAAAPVAAAPSEPAPLPSAQEEPTGRPNPFAQQAPTSARPHAELPEEPTAGPAPTAQEPPAPATVAETTPVPSAQEPPAPAATEAKPAPTAMPQEEPSATAVFGAVPSPQIPTAPTTTESPATPSAPGPDSAAPAPTASPQAAAVPDSPAPATRMKVELPGSPGSAVNPIDEPPIPDALLNQLRPTPSPQSPMPEPAPAPSPQGSEPAASPAPAGQAAPQGPETVSVSPAEASPVTPSPQGPKPGTSRDPLLGANPDVMPSLDEFPASSKSRPATSVQAAPAASPQAEPTAAASLPEPERTSATPVANAPQIVTLAGPDETPTPASAPSEAIGSRPTSPDPLLGANPDVMPLVTLPGATKPVFSPNAEPLASPSTSQPRPAGEPPPIAEMPRNTREKTPEPSPPAPSQAASAPIQSRATTGTSAPNPPQVLTLERSDGSPASPAAVAMPRAGEPKFRLDAGQPPPITQLVERPPPSRIVPPPTATVDLATVPVSTGAHAAPYPGSSSDSDPGRACRRVPRR